MNRIASLARPEIRALEPYAPAAWEPQLTRMHANELPWRLASDASACGLNRYPEPHSEALMRRLAALYQVRPEALLAGRGSDEVIDLLVRVFCRAERDSVLVCPPTFGMYALAARIQGAKLRSCALQAGRGFALDPGELLRQCGPEVKVVFLCSPNNPTGNLLGTEAVREVITALAGRALVVVDEAYIEFAGAESLVTEVARHPNLAVLRTLSKAHGLAGARCGSVIADPEVIGLLKKVIPPYAIAQPTIEAVLAALEPGALAQLESRLALVRSERTRLAQALAHAPGVVRVWPSDTNFLLVEFCEIERALQRAHRAQLLVRDARAYPELAPAVRVTVGSPADNERLLEAWS
jgi:histidinol-phosphate aminotransferase